MSRAKHQMPALVTDAEVQWVAGWLEGEGSFYCWVDTQRVHSRIALRAVSTDKETLDKVLRIAGGTISGPYKYKGNVTAYYSWSISGKATAIEAMLRFRPFMGTRRRAQIDTALARAGYNALA